MPPSILADGNRFFPNVLLDQDFQRRGVLTRTEGRVSWGVVDPRRHVMTIWEKDRFDFVEAAKARGATLISNGPFYTYTGGPKGWAVFWYGVDVFLTGIGLANATPEQVARERQRLLQDHFSAKVAEGFVIGTAEHIEEKDERRPRAHYFGRLSGRSFVDYRIQPGDPDGVPEVIGGLFRSVQDYSAIDQGNASQVGTWGLAPVLAAPEDKLRMLRDAGMEPALEAYEEAIRQAGADSVPLGKDAAHLSLDGLVIALFGGGSPAGFARMLAEILVKDAVRVDGNSSILLATGNTALQGEHMNGPKIAYNKQGYMFQPG